MRGRRERTTLSPSIRPGGKFPTARGALEAAAPLSGLTRLQDHAVGAVFVVFVLLAALCLLALQLYFAIGCLCVAFLGLARCVLSFLGRGVD